MEQPKRWPPPLSASTQNVGAGIGSDPVGAGTGTAVGANEKVSKI